jgi:SAM-dependent methyltransferase
MKLESKRMRQQAKNLITDGLNPLFGLVKLKLVWRTGAFEDYRGYIPFSPTLATAQKAGLSIGDYIDTHFNVTGATQATLDRMKELGVFQGQIDRVCEIGPGSGRYLEKTLKACSPSYCEIYETAIDWEKYLVQTYQVVAHPTDGKSLASTPSASIDLVQAHKVMPGQPSLVMCRYFEEMARVVRTGGKIVFDIVTEECLDDTTLKVWLAAGAGYQHYPCLIPKQFAIDFFQRRGCSCDGSFLVPMEPGKTECFVFTKQT